MRIPATENIIDPRPFGYLEASHAERMRNLRANTNKKTSIGYANSEARKRLEGQPEHPCYDVPKDKFDAS